MMTVEAKKSKTCNATSAPGKIPLRYFDRACRAALTASETVSKKPQVTTRPRLARRARTSRLSVEDFGLAFQMAFIADWTSPNTPVAVTISTTTPTMVAHDARIVLVGALDHFLQRLGRLLAH